MGETKVAFPKRVLVAGGVARSLVNFRATLLEAIMDAGHTLVTCAGEADAQTLAELRARNIPFHRIPFDRRGLNPIHDFSYCTTLRSLMVTFRPDLFLAYTVKPIVYGALMARSARIPRVAAMITGAGAALVHDSTPTTRHVVARLVRLLYRHALRRVDTVFFQNRDDEAYFRSHALLGASNVLHVQGSGVDLQHFRPAPPVLKPTTFLMAARLLPEKGVREYVQAARALRGQFARTRFLLLGPIESGCGLTEEEVRRWSSDGVIEYLGSVVDVRATLASASVFVLPSYYPEGRSRAIQEAMAMARPIITTDWRGCRESVENGVNGWIVPVQDVDSLTATMSRFIQEPGRIVTMGKESRRLAETLYDVRKIDAFILDSLGLTPPRRDPAGAGKAATASLRRAA